MIIEIHCWLYFAACLGRIREGIQKDRAENDGKGSREGQRVKQNVLTCWQQEMVAGVSGDRGTPELPPPLWVLNLAEGSEGAFRALELVGPSSRFSSQVFWAPYIVGHIFLYLCPYFFSSFFYIFTARVLFYFLILKSR